MGIRQNIVIIVGLIILTILGGVYFWFSQRDRLEMGGLKLGGEKSAQEIQNPNALPTIEGGTRERLFEEEIVVPEVVLEGEGGAMNGDVARPTAVISTQGTENKFRHFNLAAEGNQYIPSVIIVREGDVVDITFTSRDKDYNFFLPDLGVYKTVKSGKSENIQFQAYPFGKYTFYCKDICGNLKVEGSLLVTKD